MTPFIKTPSMARIIAIANQKGGVGKTTTAVNLAAGLVRASERVLLVDLDSQGNATMGSGVDKNGLISSTCEVLLGERSVAESRARAPEGFDLLPGNIDLTAAAIQLMEQSEREQRLKRALSPIRREYDFILIDCPCGAVAADRECPHRSGFGDCADAVRVLRAGGVECVA